jgi:peptidoglycan-N-acetylglucosamine deacetylase
VLGAAGAGTLGFIGGESAIRTAYASSVAAVTQQGSARLWWSADTTDRVAALTFDDGPTEQFTAQVLDLLDRARTAATFFVIGALVERHPDLVRRARDAGHEVGNHSYDHISAAVSGQDAVRSAMIRGADAVHAVTGTRTRWYRPPRGEVTSATVAAAAATGHDLALWSVIRGDAADADVAGVRDHLAGSLHRGAVVDLHDGIGRSSFDGAPDEQLLTRRRAELAALPEVLARWRGTGFRFVTLSGLIPPAG